MARAQRTLNPLHFEDLEPHRFEDLVRQLAYDFRPWRFLDATGRLGRDSGLDIRGVEMVGVSQASDRGLADEEDGEEELLDARAETIVERTWSIQCKRYKEIGPKLIAEIVAETIPDGSDPPYGIIIAAACDVSAESMAAFRSEAATRGTTEAHLWTRAHLEDLLFLPEHDHLLFAYFDISLGIRRRSKVHRYRERIALKRKLLRAFDQGSVTDSFMADVLVLDVEDEHYPAREDVPGFREMPCPPWHVATVEFFHWGGLWVSRYSYQGWVKEDGTWDMLEESRSIQGGTQAYSLDYWSEERSARYGYGELASKVPASELQLIRETWFLPFSKILEVDPIGDPLHPDTHIICRFDGENGPYLSHPRYFTYGSRGRGFTQLDPEERTSLFASVIGTNGDSDGDN